MTDKKQPSSQNSPPRRGGFGGHPAAALMSGTEKPKNMRKTLKKLAAYLRPSAFSIVIVVAFAVLTSIFAVLGPMFLGQATDILARSVADSAPGQFPNIDFYAIGRILAFLAVLFSVTSSLVFLQGYIMAGVTQKSVFKMRQDINAKLNRLPIKYFDKTPHGDILSRISNDVDNIANTLQQSLTQVITSLVSLIGTVIIMLTMNVTLTIVTVSFLPLTIFITVFVAKRSQKHFRNNQRELGRINGHIEEFCSGFPVVKAYSREEKVLEGFGEINDKLYAAGYKSQFYSGVIMPALHFVTNLNFIAVCIIGGLLASGAWGAAVSVGVVQAFLMYSRQFSFPIMQVANIMNVMQSTAASAERVFELLAESEEVPELPNATTLTSPKGVVNFENVRFGYTDDNILFDNLNISVEQGQTVAIVGPTGAGKTTLVNLLMRFYEIQGGKILIDGQNITNLTRGSLRDSLGMVLQDTWLFNGTILDNIAYGREGATPEDVYTAAKQAHVDNFVRVLPNGYDTILNEEASNISQGQRQLITIARAILADPSILILDEATSNVDTRTEVLIQQAMGKLMQGRTSFVIAHRLSTIKNANVILVMNNGSIIEQGTHAELLSKNGFYADLYRSQFAGTA